MNGSDRKIRQLETYRPSIDHQDSQPLYTIEDESSNESSGKKYDGSGLYSPINNDIEEQSFQYKCSDIESKWEKSHSPFPKLINFITEKPEVVASANFRKERQRTPSAVKNGLEISSVYEIPSDLKRNEPNECRPLMLPIYSYLESRDLLISISHCSGCRTHKEFRNDSLQFVARAEQLLYDISAYLHVHLKPIARVIILRVPAEASGHRLRKKKGCGFFEVQIAYQHPKHGLLADKIFSMKVAGAWPITRLVLRRVAAFQSICGIQNWYRPGDGPEGLVLYSATCLEFPAKQRQCSCRDIPSSEYMRNATSNNNVSNKNITFTATEVIPSSFSGETEPRGKYPALACFRSSFDEACLLTESHSRHPLLDANQPFIMFDTSHHAAVSAYRDLESVLFTGGNSAGDPSVPTHYTGNLPACVLRSHRDGTYDIRCHIVKKDGARETMDLLGVEENFLRSINKTPSISASPVKGTANSASQQTRSVSKYNGTEVLFDTSMTPVTSSDSTLIDHSRVLEEDSKDPIEGDVFNEDSDSDLEGDGWNDRLGSRSVFMSGNVGGEGVVWDEMGEGIDSSGNLPPKVLFHSLRPNENIAAGDLHNRNEIDHETFLQNLQKKSNSLPILSSLSPTFQTKVEPILSVKNTVPTTPIRNVSSPNKGSTLLYLKTTNRRNHDNDLGALIYKHPTIDSVTKNMISVDSMIEVESRTTNGFMRLFNQKGYIQSKLPLSSGLHWMVIDRK